jgi:hypothetical protein
MAALAGAPRNADGAAAIRLGNTLDSEARLRRDVTFLASPECEGRGPLTKGIDKAADYIEAEFKKAGLKPGNADSYFQPFTIPGALRTGPSKLLLKGPAGQTIELVEGKHFQGVGMATAGKVDGAAAAFAGYGISATGPDYDDYDGLDVRGKVVIVLRDVPRTTSKDLPRSFRIRHSSLTSKLVNAEKKKAAAVLFVNDAAGARDGDQLLDFNFTALSRSPAKLPALHVRRSVLESMLQSSAALNLSDIEKTIDRNFEPNSIELKGWTVTLEVQSKRDRIGLRNVIGVLEGRGPLAKETIVIGAHYDHLGYGGTSSRTGAKKMAIHHGADDNASGTTAIMELARRLAARQNREGRRLVFMAYSGEELGLLGSRHYCKSPIYPLTSTAAMFNLDMVGRLRVDAKTKKERVLSEGSGTAKDFKPLLDTLMTKYDFQHSAKASGFGPSDHASFCAKKVPVLFLWTGNHADYHMPTDTADKINVQGMRRIVDLSEEVVSYLATVKTKPAFVEVKGGGGPRPSGGPRLGITPDYGNEQDDGVEVLSVAEGAPAERAGIKSGDRIVAIANKEVKNLQTYMTAMAPQKPGTTIDVVVVRGGKKVTLKVKLD